MKIFNPATGAELADLTADNAKAVAAKYVRARAAQPAWARRPLRHRLAVMTRFRGLLVTRRQNLILTDRAAIEKLAYHQ